MATAPYQKDGKWWMDVDPDDHNYVVWNVTNDLTDRNTTATAVSPVVNGVTMLEAPVVQGSLIVAKVTIDPVHTGTPWATARVACANTEQFDRTIYFNLEEH